MRRCAAAVERGRADVLLQPDAARAGPGGPRGALRPAGARPGGGAAEQCRCDDDLAALRRPRRTAPRVGLDRAAGGMLRPQRRHHRQQRSAAGLRNLRRTARHARAVRVAGTGAAALERAGLQYAAPLPVPVLRRPHARPGGSGDRQRRTGKARDRRAPAPRAAALPQGPARAPRAWRDAVAGPAPGAAARDFGRCVRRADGRGRQCHCLLPALVRGTALVCRVAVGARGRGLVLARRRARRRHRPADARRPAAAADRTHRPPRPGAGRHACGARLQDAECDAAQAQAGRGRGRLPAAVLRAIARRCGGWQLGVARRREGERARHRGGATRGRPARLPGRRHLARTADAP
ncbi:hypothetical protein D9M70_477180 [compost metagenome]